MAFQMEYTEPVTQGGTPHPESYWRINFEAASLPDRSGRLEFGGYHDAKVAALEGAGTIGTPKSYTLSPAELLDVLAIMKTGRNAQGESMTLYQWGYAKAKASKDTETGEIDRDGRQVMASFFENAMDA